MRALFAIAFGFVYGVLLAHVVRLAYDLTGLAYLGRWEWWVLLVLYLVALGMDLGDDY